MTMTKMMLGAGAALAAIATAAPASAQYSPYRYNNYGYSQPYSSYGYGQRYNNYNYNYARPYAMNTSAATQQCMAAVQNRLANRASIGGIIGALLGANTTGQVVGVTDVRPRSNGMTRVRGVASSGRYAMNGYGPYGVGAYGALGYGAQSTADLSFRCDVDYAGYVRNVDINRR
jgi:hypothetical protein